MFKGMNLRGSFRVGSEESAAWETGMFCFCGDPESAGCFNGGVGYISRSESVSAGAKELYLFISAHTHLTTVHKAGESRPGGPVPQKR